MPSDHKPAAIRVTVRREGRLISSDQFDRAEIRLGRSPRSEVFLDDPQVSWTHAVLHLDDDGHIILADRSSNGCFRNGERITQANLGFGGVVSIPPFEVDAHLGATTRSEEIHPATLVGAPVAAPSVRESRIQAMSQRSSAAVRPSTRALLRIVMGPGTLLGRVYDLGPKVHTVGRAPDCDIRLEPRSISRYHARLTPAGEDRWTVEDAGSENGIEINGVLMQSADIGFGDRIGFGNAVVGVLQPAAVAAAAAAVEEKPTEHTTREALIVSHAQSRFSATATLIRVAGRVDSYSYTYLRDQIARAADEGRRLLVVDLSECSYCDHAGLGVLVSFHVSLKQKRAGLCLVGLNSQLRDAFHLLRLDRVLSVAPDEAAAIKELERRLR